VTAFLRIFLGFALALLSLLPSSGWAQSACTAIWGVDGNAPAGLRYLNRTTGQWSASLLNLTGTANALAGSSANGLLYYVDRGPRQLYSVNLNVFPLASTLIGTIPDPPAPANAGNMLGGTTDAAGNLFIYATSSGSASPTYAYVTVAQVSTANAATVTSWTQIRTTANATPTLLGSGDSFIDQSGVNWIISNTTIQPTLHQLDLNPGASFGRTNSPPLALTGVNNMQVAAVSTDPVSGLTYLGGLEPGGAPYTSTTFEVNLSTGVTTRLLQTDTSFYMSDMGNCTVPPAAPTISKSFNPVSRPTAPGTSTLQITLSNSNTVPIWLNRTLTDTLPAGLLVGPIPSLQGSCITTGNTITAAGGAGVATMSAGSRIPAGGCTFSFVVRAAAAGSFNNVIAVGALDTTSGSNAATAEDIFQVASTDFSMDKTQRVGTTGAFSNTPISVPTADTLQFLLTIVNGAGSVGAGTVTYTDTLPIMITPVISVTATPSGGGTCSTATAVVGGRTRITGTRTAAPVGSTCTILITARASVTNVVSTFDNTTTIAPRAPSTDSNAVNNGSTVTVTIIPKTTLTIAKNDGTLTFSPGGTTAYTITVVNLGPAAADGAQVLDPIATGLNCSTVVCTTAGGAACPTPPLSLATFQNTGIPVSPFPANSTATFVLSCTVTATGS
jgi:uncharacterized repeat protein (TIGR01451 family)